MGKQNGLESPLWYFFLGGITGMAVAMLFAPKSGKKTREFIGEKATEGKEAVERSMDNVRNQVHRYREKAASESQALAEKGKNLLEKERETIASAIEAGIQAYKEKCKFCE